MYTLRNLVSFVSMGRNIKIQSSHNLLAMAYLQVHLWIWWASDALAEKWEHSLRLLQVHSGLSGTGFEAVGWGCPTFHGNSLAIKVTALFNSLFPKLISTFHLRQYFHYSLHWVGWPKNLSCIICDLIRHWALYSQTFCSLFISPELEVWGRNASSFALSWNPFPLKKEWQKFQMDWI